jgi:hypothetical protein
MNRYPHAGRTIPDQEPRRCRRGREPMLLTEITNLTKRYGPRAWQPGTMRAGPYRANRAALSMTPQEVKPVMRCHPVHSPPNRLRT